MSTPTIRRGRRKAWAIVAALAFGLVGLFMSAGTASAQPFTCTFAAPTLTILIANESVTVQKGNLSQIRVNGAQCTGGGLIATTNNTDTIVVTDTSGVLSPFQTSLNIDLSGGMFEPGATALGEAPLSQNEIEWVLTNVDAVVVTGSAAPETIYIGDGTVDGSIINLNGDDDGDVIDTTLNTVEGVNAITVHGQGGNDLIDASGSHGTGGPSPADCTGINLGLVRPLILTGGAGNDVLRGGNGDDNISGGEGDDFIDGGGSCESTDFGAQCFAIFSGPDVLPVGFTTGDWVNYSGAAAGVTVDLDSNGAIGSGTGEGTDTITNVENIIGSAFNDTLSGDNTNNIILGGGGDDTIAGDAGNDCEFGNDGNDTFDENEGTGATNNGADIMLGNAGLDDHVNYSSRTTRIVVYLEPLPDFGVGTFDDCGFNQGRQAQGLFGGGFAPDGADVDGDGDATSFPDEFDCVYLDTENVTTGSGNDIHSANFINNGADNEFTGNAGNDIEVGGRGNDIFHEGTAPQGSDDLDGGTGSDTCDYSGRTGPLNVALDGNDNDGEAGEGDNCGGVVSPFGFFGLVRAAGGGGEGDPSTQENVENINAGSGNDILTGSNEANIINGNGGNDVINGAGGNDVINGGDGTDWADFETSAKAVTVNLAAGSAVGDGSDVISATENVNGSSLNDNLIGDGNANVLNGRGGNDQLKGNAGGDTLNGAAGNDTANGGADDDSVNGQGGNDNLRGAGGDDSLNGGAGRDTLFGGNGDDSLFGGANPDAMNGGRGSDRCRPGQPGLGRGDTATGCEA